MEHRTLTDPRALVVRANALATYLGLVGSVNGSVVTRPHGFTLVRGPGMFSFCNFAAGFSLRPDEVEAAIVTLAENADACFGFYTFVMTGDEPCDLAEQLIAKGFERRHSLVGMVSEIVPELPDLAAHAVTSQEDRRKVAGFMARQFFWRMPREAKEAIAAATSASPHTIWTVGAVDEPEAAVMLVQDTASIGLFNLCVRPDLRRKGLGGNLVRAVQRAAAAQARPVALQCEATLVPWYGALGFEVVGTIDAFALSDDDVGDIIA